MRINITGDGCKYQNYKRMKQATIVAIFISRASTFLPKNSGVRPTIRPLINTAIMEAREMKIATIVALLHPFVILVFTAISSYIYAHYPEFPPISWLTLMQTPTR